MTTEPITPERLMSDAAAEIYRLRAALADAHPHYTSTYCIHGNHADCRLTCKTCKAPCRCSCHIGEEPQP